MPSNAAQNTRQVWIGNAVHAAALKRKLTERRDLRVTTEMAIAKGLGFEADPKDPDSSPLTVLEKEYEKWLADPNSSNRFAVDEAAQERARKRAAAKEATVAKGKKKVAA